MKIEIDLDDITGFKGVMTVAQGQHWLSGDTDDLSGDANSAIDCAVSAAILHGKAYVVIEITLADEETHAHPHPTSI